MLLVNVPLSVCVRSLLLISAEGLTERVIPYPGLAPVTYFSLDYLFEPHIPCKAGEKSLVTSSFCIPFGCDFEVFSRCCVDNNENLPNPL